MTIADLPTSTPRRLYMFSESLVVSDEDWLDEEMDRELFLDDDLDYEKNRYGKEKLQRQQQAQRSKKHGIPSMHSRRSSITGVADFHHVERQSVAGGDAEPPTKKRRLTAGVPVSPQGSPTVQR